MAVGEGASGIAVRLASTDELPAFALLFDLYRQFYAQASDVNAAAAFLRQRLERAESVLLGAWLEGDLVGFCQSYPGHSSISLKPAWVLNDLYVLPELRRYGVADALMAAMETLAAAAGVSGMLLQTAVDNRPAQGLYARRGWRLDSMFYTYEWDPPGA